ncbi:MAG: SDR family oxidoreductase [Actinomycetota bacterium]|nr:SDR family oxidoreductase [Actinomycetota bacterium]
MSVSIDLSGRRALITGSGQGVGAAIAATLAEAGAEVVVNDLVPERAEAGAAALRAQGHAAQAAAFDVTDLSAVSAAFARVGAIDILVNNAGNAGGDGWTAMTPFHTTSPADWSKFINVNLYGVMNCVHAALPGMIQGKWGRVVTIISDAGRVGEPSMAAYAAAKGGAAAFTRAVAHEVGRHNITANNISLGTMRTPLSEDRWATISEADAKVVLQRYLVRRPGLPADVAALALYLASDGAEWVTAQTYPLNGGYSSAL